MKRYLILAMLGLLTITSCKKESFSSSASKEEESSQLGTLSFVGLAVNVDESLTRATEAKNSYLIYVYDSEGVQVVSKTYAQVKEKSIELPAGTYTLKVQSAEELPYAEFEDPVYGASKEVTIQAGATTEAGEITCRLLQVAVTVSYTDEFLSDVTGNCTTSVELTRGYPLDYELTYNGGNISYNRDRGYFAKIEGSNTMEVTFKGIINGKSQRMTKSFSDVQAAQLRAISFVKKVDATGNATFDISIDTYVDDNELNENITGAEDVTGSDPNAPTGDGGIVLESTCDYDLSQPIVIPKVEEKTLVLTMKATVPYGVRKFVVDVESTNADFPGALAAVNNGETTLDLVNPSEGAIQIFQTIVPFPYGDDVDGKTEIAFDLSPAQTPILGFVGTHTFIMKVTDNQGHKKEIPVAMTVE